MTVKPAILIIATDSDTLPKHRLAFCPRS